MKGQLWLVCHSGNSHFCPAEGIQAIIFLFAHPVKEDGLPCIVIGGLKVQNTLLYCFTTNCGLGPAITLFNTFRKQP